MTVLDRVRGLFATASKDETMGQRTQEITRLAGSVAEHSDTLNSRLLAYMDKDDPFVAMIADAHLARTIAHIADDDRKVIKAGLQ